MEIVASAGGNISRVQQIFGGDPVGIYNTNASKRVSVTEHHRRLELLQFLITEQVEMHILRL